MAGILYKSRDNASRVLFLHLNGQTFQFDIHISSFTNDMRRSSRLVSSSNEAVAITRAKTETKEPRPSSIAMASQKKRAASVTDSDAFEYDSSNSGKQTAAPKKRKTAKTTVKRSNGSSGDLHRLFDAYVETTTLLEPCTLPRRQHSLSYHRPLLLDQRHNRTALLTWFDNIFTARGMPWRKAWIDPSSVADVDALRQQLERRAYEVWISEIMLQQTRVAVVIEYWNRWMAKWPTIHELAAASPDDVLAMWRGLGYYSRATRIHEAAKLVCGDSDMKGLLVDDVTSLQKKIPGVGRYTAGAITAIVFGKASPMVDGNVLRVLSRQLGLFGDVKTDKTTIDLLWMAADSLVKAVAKDDEHDATVKDETKAEPQVSDRPGRWGQALMELGSTVCTPKPNCAACPITATCRAYAEGLQHATKKRSKGAELSTVDIEDGCDFCKPFEEFADLDECDDEKLSKISARSKTATATSGSKKQASLSSFFFTPQTRSSKLTERTTESPPEKPDAGTSEKISNHARKFPIKTIKKAVREEETLVCAIQRKSDRHFIIQKRPEKGLLAGLWEFPSCLLTETAGATAKSRKAGAFKFVEGLFKNGEGKHVNYVGDLGSVPWLFSHIKLTMHVHLFELSDEGSSQCFENDFEKRSRWTDDVESESMGTGMRKCWDLVEDRAI